MRKSKLANNNTTIIRDIIYEAQSQNSSRVNQIDSKISKKIDNDEALSNLFEAWKSKSKFKCLTLM